MKLSKLMESAPREHSLEALAALLDSLECIVEYSSEGREAFFGSRENQDAIMYRLVCAGEACKRFCRAYEGSVPIEGNGRTKNVNADLPKVGLTDEQWKGIIRMRDTLGHKIDEQNLQTVWTVVEDKVPAMVEPVESAVRWATINWLDSEDTPGRRRAKEMASKHLKDSLTSFREAMTRSAREAVEKHSKELTENILNQIRRV